MTAGETYDEVVSAGELLAVASYAGANLGRRLIDLVQLIRRLHEPIEGNTARPVVCTTCRDSRGRRLAFPCEEFVRSAEIMGLRLDPTAWDELGVSLPASLRAPAAIEQGLPS